MKRKYKIILLLSSGREHDRGFSRGVVSYAKVHGPWIFFEETPAYISFDSEKQRIAYMKSWQADGMIALEDRSMEIKALKLPTVISGSARNLPANIPQTRTDNEALGIMAANHLMNLGHNRLAYFGLDQMEWSSERLKGLCQRAAGADIKVNVYRHPLSGSRKALLTDVKHLGDWLENLPKPVGLMACNDDQGQMIAEICCLRNIRVPEEISIIGVDNDEQVCSHSSPPLSSIGLATERAGYEAAELLDRMITGRQIANNIITVHPTQVVARQSTDILTLDDVNMVRALRFIKENSNRIIQAKDVVAVSGLSRTLLQRRFLKTIGRTILEAIHEARINFISQMLSETYLSVSAIASAIGYETDTHLARFFARRTGMPPVKYRRRHSREHTGSGALNTGLMK